MDNIFQLINNNTELKKERFKVLCSSYGKQDQNYYFDLATCLIAKIHTKQLVKWIENSDSIIDNPSPLIFLSQEEFLEQYKHYQILKYEAQQHAEEQAPDFSINNYAQQLVEIMRNDINNLNYTMQGVYLFYFKIYQNILRSYEEFLNNLDYFLSLSDLPQKTAYNFISMKKMIEEENVILPIHHKLTQHIPIINNIFSIKKYTLKNKKYIKKGLDKEKNITYNKNIEANSKKNRRPSVSSSDNLNNKSNIPQQFSDTKPLVIIYDSDLLQTNKKNTNSLKINKIFNFSLSSKKVQNSEVKNHLVLHNYVDSDNDLENSEQKPHISNVIDHITNGEYYSIKNYEIHSDIDSQSKKSYHILLKVLSDENSHLHDYLLQLNSLKKLIEHMHSIYKYKDIDALFYIEKIDEILSYQIHCFIISYQLKKKSHEQNKTQSDENYIIEHFSNQLDIELDKIIEQIKKQIEEMNESYLLRLTQVQIDHTDKIYKYTNNHPFINLVR